MESILLRDSERKKVNYVEKKKKGSRIRAKEGERD